MITLIWAQDLKKGIGIDNKLPWNIPEEMRHFKLATINKTVVMGYNTYLSIGHPLPNRENVILTRNPDTKIEGATVCHSLEDVLVKYQGQDIYVIGGKSVYELFFPYADNLIISQINNDFKCNVFMDKIDLSKFKLINQENHNDVFTVLSYKRNYLVNNVNPNIFNIKISEFEGPLDVLERMVIEKSVDIFEINLLEIIDQYLEFVERNIDYININNSISFLEMASRLVKIKSEKLLNNNVEEATHNLELERDKLMHQLIEHNRYKRICAYLRTRMEHRDKMYSRFDDESEELISETTVYNEKMPGLLNPNILAKIVNNLVEKYRFNLIMKKGMTLKEINSDHVTDDLIEFLKKNKKTTLCKYIVNERPDEDKTISYFVVLFYAFLELSKVGGYEITQMDDDLSILYK